MFYPNYSVFTNVVRVRRKDGMLSNSRMNESSINLIPLTATSVYRRRFVMNTGKPLLMINFFLGLSSFPRPSNLAQ